MMRRLAMLLALLPAGFAQEEEAPPPKPAATAKDESVHEVRLRSGSALVGRLEPAVWRIRTAFGELEVPAREIRRVRFGRRSQPERLVSVEKSLADLASGNPETRERAREALKAAGAFGAPSLARALKEDEDPEVRRICEELLDEMGLDPEEYVQEDDVLETTRFNLQGAVELNAFQVHVPELGPLVVRRGDIVSIRQHLEQHARKIAVDGSHVWPNGWLDTKHKVNKGDPLHVTATGTIHFPNWGQVFTPDGNPHMGVMNVGALNVTIGTLVGRIGNAGTPFRIGSSFSGKAPGAGTLQLIVVMNVQGQPHNGEYSVTIRDAE